MPGIPKISGISRLNREIFTIPSKNEHYLEGIELVEINKNEPSESAALLFSLMTSFVSVMRGRGSATTRLLSSATRASNASMRCSVFSDCRSKVWKKVNDCR
jgi:hypothetical protein